VGVVSRKKQQKNKCLFGESECRMTKFGQECCTKLHTFEKFSSQYPCV